MGNKIEPDAPRAVKEVDLVVRIPGGVLPRLRGWITRQPEPRPTLVEAVRRLVSAGLDAADRERSLERAARNAEIQREAALAKLEIEQARAQELAKTKRLRALRLEKEVTPAPSTPKPLESTEGIEVQGEPPSAVKEAHRVRCSTVRR